MDGYSNHNEYEQLICYDSNSVSSCHSQSLRRDLLVHLVSLLEKVSPQHVQDFDQPGVPCHRRFRLKRISRGLSLALAPYEGSGWPVNIPSPT